MPFSEAVRDVSGGNAKLPQSEFKTEGRLPVVDQGQDFVAGYTDDASYEFRSESLPVVIFGDHTRLVKYVDFPFAMGADGVKVLKPGEHCDAKYLYHYLRQVRIPNAGYSRHYKFLKELRIPLPSLPEQRRIAEILDKADMLRAKRRAALAEFDILTQSIFLDMFGDPATNPKGWPIHRLDEVVSMPLRNGLSPSRTGKSTAKVLTLSAITGSAFDSSAWKISTFQSPPPSDQSVDERDFLICRGNGNIRLVGKGYFPSHRMADVTFPDTVIAARISPTQIERDFLQHVWNSTAVRRQIQSAARTTNGTFKVNQTILERISFVLPPGPLQRNFASRVVAIAKLKSAHGRSLAQLDALFASLQHRAFRGEL